MPEKFTAQRPTDVLRMAWPQYSGSAIRLRQQKTGALLDIPVHPVLRDHLDGLSRSGSSLTIVAFRGRPVKYLRFNVTGPDRAPQADGGNGTVVSWGTGSRPRSIPTKSRIATES
jgi:hypothetical protein